MKFLVWMEENTRQKFETQEQILEAHCVCLFPEVDQNSSRTISEWYYQALPSSVAIHKDHFVRIGRKGWQTTIVDLRAAAVAVLVSMKVGQRLP